MLKTIMGRIICVLCRTSAAQPSFGPAVLQGQMHILDDTLQMIQAIRQIYKWVTYVVTTVVKGQAALLTWTQLVVGFTSKDFARCVGPWSHQNPTAIPGYHVRYLTDFNDLSQPARPAAAAIPFKPPPLPLPQTQPRPRCRHSPGRVRGPALSLHPLPGHHPRRLHSRAPPPPHPPRVSSPQIER